MDERFTAQMYVKWVASEQGITIEDLGVAPVVVISWSRRVIRALAESLSARPAENWLYADQYPLYVGEIKGHRFSLAHVPIGAPGTVMVMEEMIACGGRVFLGLGWAGSLRPEAPVGTFLIPTTCVSEEGTSQHYLDSNATVSPSERLANLLKSVSQAEGIHAITGHVWSTDAPYRELVSKIEAYRRKGVLGVDMETSAMYTLGMVRKVEVCNLLVVSDELWREWRPAFGTPELRKAEESAKAVIQHCLRIGLDV